MAKTRLIEAEICLVIFLFFCLTEYEKNVIIRIIKVFLEKYTDCMLFFEKELIVFLVKRGVEE